MRSTTWCPGKRATAVLVDPGRARGPALRVCLYALLNPVAAGIVGHPRDWPWSSFRAMVAGELSLRLQAILGDTPGEASARLVALVDDAVEVIDARQAAEAATTWRIAGVLAERVGSRGVASAAPLT